MTTGKAAKKTADAERQARIQPLLDYWVPLLGLGDWKITWELVDKLSGAAWGGEEAGARVGTVGPYQQAHIKFARSHVDECVLPYELEHTVIHELGHCLTHSLQATLREELTETSGLGREVGWQIETLCDTLATAFWQLRYGTTLPIGYSPVPVPSPHSGPTITSDM